MSLQTEMQAGRCPGAAFWTDEKNALLEQLLCSGTNFVEIADKLGYQGKVTSLRAHVARKRRAAGNASSQAPRPKMLNEQQPKKLKEQQPEPRRFPDRNKPAMPVKNKSAYSHFVRTSPPSPHGLWPLAFRLPRCTHATGQSPTTICLRSKQSLNPMLFPGGANCHVSEQRNQQLKELTANHPGLLSTEASKQLFAMWKGLTTVQKQPFKEAADSGPLFLPAGPLLGYSMGILLGYRMAMSDEWQVFDSYPIRRPSDKHRYDREMAAFQADCGD
eukprot:SAG11_NODE_8939_length_961_cov_0.704176_2_plen_273_part_01